MKKILLKLRPVQRALKPLIKGLKKSGRGFWRWAVKNKGPIATATAAAAVGSTVGAIVSSALQRSESAAPGGLPPDVVNDSPEQIGRHYDRLRDLAISDAISALRGLSMDSHSSANSGTQEEAIKLGIALGKIMLSLRDEETSGVFKTSLQLALACDTLDALPTLSDEPKLMLSQMMDNYGGLTDVTDADLQLAIRFVSAGYKFV